MADVDTSGTHVYLVLMKAQRALAAHAQRSFAQMKLGPSEFILLEALLHKGPMLVSELGERMTLTSGATTTAVDRLEQRKLVTRSAAEHDGRATQVTLTRSGQALIEKAFAEHKKRMDATAGGLTVPERKVLMGLLKKLGLEAEASLGESGRRRRIRRG